LAGQCSGMTPDLPIKTGMDAFRRSRIQAGLWLLPPERWFAVFTLNRQRTHRTQSILALEQNYGPEGIVLMAACVVVGLCASVFACLGVTLLLLSADHGPLMYAGYGFLCATAAAGCLGVIRGVQGGRAARRFQAAK
jgi:hypothetical protein